MTDSPICSRRVQEAERTGRKTGAENLAQSHTDTNKWKKSSLRWDGRKRRERRMLGVHSQRSLSRGIQVADRWESMTRVLRDKIFTLHRYDFPTALGYFKSSVPQILTSTSTFELKMLQKYVLPSLPPHALLFYFSLNGLNLHNVCQSYSRTSGYGYFCPTVNTFHFTVASSCVVIFMCLRQN